MHIVHVLNKCLQVLLIVSTCTDMKHAHSLVVYMHAIVIRTCTMYYTYMFTAYSRAQTYHTHLTYPHSHLHTLTHTHTHSHILTHQIIHTSHMSNTHTHTFTHITHTCQLLHTHTHTHTFTHITHTHMSNPPHTHTPSHITHSCKEVSTETAAAPRQQYQRR